MTPKSETTQSLTAEELAALEKLRAEVDRLHGHFVDGGCKSMGVAQQLSYAEEELGKAMVDNRHALLATPSRLVEIESALDYLEQDDPVSVARELGWTSPTQKPNDGGRDG